MRSVRPDRRNRAERGLASSKVSSEDRREDRGAHTLGAVGKDTDELAQRLGLGPVVRIVRFGMDQPGGNAVRVLPFGNQSTADRRDIAGDGTAEAAAIAVIGLFHLLGAGAEQDEFERPEALQADAFLGQRVEAENRLILFGQRRPAPA